MQLTPKQLVAWILAVGLGAVVAMAGFALAHDVWIADFPRLRALLSLDSRLVPLTVLLFVAALPPTLVVFLHSSSRDQVEFSFLGMKIKGPAAGPVLWAILFLVTAFVLTVSGRLLGLI
jgi:hypothetical protein